MKPATEGEEPGLPALRTWRGVYWFVCGSFLLWVGLLVALDNLFS